MTQAHAATHTELHDADTQPVDPKKLSELKEALHELKKQAGMLEEEDIQAAKKHERVAPFPKLSDLPTMGAKLPKPTISDAELTPPVSTLVLGGIGLLVLSIGLGLLAFLLFGRSQ